MLLKEDIQRIVQTIAEAKRPIVGAAKASQTWSRVRKIAREHETSNLEKVSTGITDKTHVKVVNRLQELHDEIHKLTQHSGTPPKVVDRIKSARVISRLQAAIKDMTGNEEK